MLLFVCSVGCGRAGPHHLEGPCSRAGAAPILCALRHAMVAQYAASDPSRRIRYCRGCVRSTMHDPPHPSTGIGPPARGQCHRD